MDVHVIFTRSSWICTSRWRGCSVPVLHLEKKGIQIAFTGTTYSEVIHAMEYILHPGVSAYFLIVPGVWLCVWRNWSPVLNNEGAEK